jgi:hypothetical protein
MQGMDVSFAQQVLLKVAMVFGLVITLAWTTLLGYELLEIGEWILSDFVFPGSK